MVKRPRPTIVALAALAAAAAAWAYYRGLGEGGLPAPLAAGAEPRASEPALPRIGLARLAEPAGEAQVGSRDLFRFGQPRPSAAPAEGPVSVPSAAPAPVQVEETPLVPPPPPTLPPLAVKFVGALEQKGTKVAVLLSEEKKEILTGREGDTVANRLKIVKIGLESVDVQDLGSDRVRRIPLRGN